MRCVDRFDFLSPTRDGYDRTAAAYAERFHRHLDDKPVDLGVVNVFASWSRSRVTGASLTWGAGPVWLPRCCTVLA
ncbi:hypothetical protein ABIA30_005426 [Mycobacterium sp. MAA66]